VATKNEDHNEQVLNELLDYLKTRNVEVVITRPEDIPGVVHVSEGQSSHTCGFCGEQIRHVLVIPKAKRGKNSVRSLSVCPDQMKCYERVAERQKERARRLATLAKSIKFPTVVG
jgi:hypothetical protein